jgi:hypothetical protein
MKRKANDISDSSTLNHELELDRTLHFLFGSSSDENENTEVICAGDFSDSEEIVHSYNKKAKRRGLLEQARYENDKLKTTDDKSKKAAADRSKKSRHKRKESMDCTTRKSITKAKNEKDAIKRSNDTSLRKAALDFQFKTSSLVETAVGIFQYLENVFYIELKPNCDILNKANGHGAYCIMIKNSQNLFCYKFCIIGDGNVDFSKDKKARVIVVKSLASKSEILLEKYIRFSKSYSISFEAKSFENISECKPLKKHTPLYLGKSKRISFQPHFFNIISTAFVLSFYYDVII